ncbi:MAG TPA: undecaprenyl-phosphate glucose phosphotransferase [Thermoanaerobaculia bacterium]|nr:undecaprenyl-phosphate glucose phosphotransferase [Thermoanaerobaculia bacterium]
MIQRKYERLAAVYVINDVAASAMALMMAYWLRFAVQVIPLTKGPQELAIYARILPLVLLVFPLAFAFQGLYRIRPTRRPVEEWVAVTAATVLGSLALSGILLWFRPEGVLVEYSRAMLGLFVVCEIVLVMAGRTLVRRAMQRRYRAGRSLERVLVAGSGELAKAVVARLRSHQELGFSLAGYVSEEGAIEGLPRLGSLADAGKVVTAEGIDHVFVALPHGSSSQMMELLDRLTRETIASLHVVPDLLQFMAIRSRVEDVDGLPTINLSETPLDGWSLALKRLFDLAFAAIALILLAPLMLIVALLIRLEDRGPVFYRQIRMGLDGVAFQILKFRSMRIDAETDSGAKWADREDPRRTRMGRWIRAWSLDELPQLLNVILGEMSLVGPRPERPEFVALFRAEYPHYMLRHKVRAGMTGWAQVHGWRGNTSVRMRLEHDLYYIENWSLLLDLKILLMTLRHGLKHENAY